MAVMIATVLVAAVIAMVFFFLHCDWVVVESSQSVDLFTSWQHMNTRFFLVFII